MLTTLKIEVRSKRLARCITISFQNKIQMVRYAGDNNEEMTIIPIMNNRFLKSRLLLQLMSNISPNLKPTDRDIWKWATYPCWSDEEFLSPKRSLFHKKIRWSTVLLVNQVSHSVSSCLENWNHWNNLLLTFSLEWKFWKWMAILGDIVAQCMTVGDFIGFSIVSQVLVSRIDERVTWFHTAIKVKICIIKTRFDMKSWLFAFFLTDFHMAATAAVGLSVMVSATFWVSFDGSACSICVINDSAILTRFSPVVLW